jgi:hypothetical protein
MTPPPSDGLLLPEGTRLVHIGPPKTGTTSVQSAFDTGRGRLKPQGVRYAGRSRQPADAVLAVTERPSGLGPTPPPMSRWTSLLREIEGAREPRVVISSEFFADAQSPAIRRVADDLGRDRIHVVVTLRPLTRIVASQWQQYVQSGSRTALGPWLEGALGEQGKGVSPTFWVRHRHDELVRRWADVVGPERLTVIVLDEEDHDFVLRVFERLLGLRAGTLEAVEELSNRSMSMAEVEVVRAFNLAFNAAGLSKGLHTRIMRRGAARHIKMTRTPAPGEPKVELPQWALDRAGAIAAAMVPKIEATGVKVVGDLSKLLVVPRSRLAGDEIPPVLVDPEIGGVAAMGVLLATGLPRRDLANKAAFGPAWLRERDAPLEPPELELISTPRLAAALARRLGHRVQGAVLGPVRRAGRRFLGGGGS